jgi:hypothetical protein
LLHETLEMFNQFPDTVRILGKASDHDSGFFIAMNRGIKGRVGRQLNI